jgi:hypothetical protein
MFAVTTNTYAPKPAHETPNKQIAKLPVYRIFLRSAQITADWFGKIRFPIELHDTHLIPHGTEYQIAVESLVCETSGAHNRVVVLHCDEVRGIYSCESKDAGAKSGSSVLAQTSVGNGSGGFYQMITHDTIGMRCDLNVIMNQKAITLQIKNFDDTAFVEGNLGTGHGDWAVSLIIYPIKE